MEVKVLGECWFGDLFRLGVFSLCEVNIDFVCWGIDVVFVVDIVDGLW